MAEEKVTPLMYVQGPGWELFAWAEKDGSVWFQVDERELQANVEVVRTLLLALEDDDFLEEYKALLRKYGYMPEQQYKRLEG